MKVFSPFFASAAAVAMFGSAFAASTPGVMSDYLPVGSLIQGRVVQPQVDPEIAIYLKKVDEKFKALSEDVRTAMLSEREKNPDSPLPYDEKLWDSKDEYKAYKAIWDKREIKAADVVAMGLNPSGEPNVWYLNSGTIDPKDKQLKPLLLTALKYDSKNNEWISNNGVLKSKGAVTRSVDSLFGAAKGHEWRLETSDSLVKLHESVIFTKSTDGKYVYAYYNMSESSAVTGTQLAKGSFVLRFATQSSVGTTPPIGGAGKR